MDFRDFDSNTGINVRVLPAGLRLFVSQDPVIYARAYFLLSVNEPICLLIDRLVTMLMWFEVYTITLKMADQGRSDFYVVFIMSLCAL